MVQNLFDQNLDVYTRRARLSPALLVVLPLTLTVLACFPNEFTSLGVFVSLVVCAGGIALFAQIGRDVGKHKEPSLFILWDGKPTTRILRHRHAANSKVLARRHDKLQQLLPNLQIPIAAEEAASPDLADQVYEACADLLRAKTRDREKFPLVFEENCNYGFRRNLWGMKLIGITLSAIGVLADLTLVAINHFVMKISIPLFVIVCVSVNILFFILWIFLITPTWVKLAADAYAERLLEACENL